MPEDKVSLLLVDDERLIRQGMALLLGSDPRLTIAGEAADGEEAVKLARELDPDVILMDIRMPVMDGREATRLICEQNPSARILVLTTFSDIEYIREAMKYGASGYLLKDSSPDLIIESIIAVAHGSIVVHPDVASSLLKEEGSAASKPDPAEQARAKAEELGLSPSESEIVRLVASGHSNREIAETLFLSEGTVKNKLSAVLQKLDLRDRTQLAIFAWKNGLTQKE